MPRVSVWGVCTCVARFPASMSKKREFFLASHGFVHKKFPRHNEVEMGTPSHPWGATVAQ